MAQMVSGTNTFNPVFFRISCSGYLFLQISYKSHILCHEPISVLVLHQILCEGVLLLKVRMLHQVILSRPGPLQLR